MTGSANCDIVSKGRRDSCGAKLIGVLKDLAEKHLENGTLSREGE